MIWWQADYADGDVRIIRLTSAALWAFWWDLVIYCILSVNRGLVSSCNCFIYREKEYRWESTQHQAESCNPYFDDPTSDCCKLYSYLFSFLVYIIAEGLIVNWFQQGHLVDLVQSEVKALLQSALDVALSVVRANPTVLEGLGAHLEGNIFIAYTFC